MFVRVRADAEGVRGIVDPGTSVTDCSPLPDIGAGN